VWAPMFLSAIPFALVTYFVNHYFPAHNLAVFFLQVIAVLPVFIVVVGWIFRSFISSQILPKVRLFISAGETR